MTPQELMQHPFWGMFQSRLGAVFNGLVQQGKMSPAEMQICNQLLQHAGPGMQGFVNGLIARYPNINSVQMDSEIETGFLPYLRQQAQQQLMAMQRGMGGGYGGFGGGAPGFGGNPMFGGMGMMGGMPRPGGFGLDPSFQRNQQMGGAPDFFRAAPQPGTGANLFGGPAAKPGAIKPDIKPPAAPQPKPVWAVPELVDSKDGKLVGGVELKLGKFKTSGDGTCRRAMVFDPRIRYTCDQEAINAYKPIFKGSKPGDKQLLTVVYKQLKVFDVNRSEFMTMASMIMTEVLKNNQSVESKLRAMISVLKTGSVNCMEACTKLFLDELDDHFQSGELVDMTHPKNIMNRFDSIDTVLDLVTGDIDKDMLNALNSMKGFRERLIEIINAIIDTLITNLAKRVIDPLKDPTVLDDYARVLPQIWSEDNGNSFRGTDDYFNIFLATRETVSGSRSDSAMRADSELKIKLSEADKHFTVLYVHRIATWCNYPKSVGVAYDDNGECQPHVTELNNPDNDISFFLSEVLRWCSETKATYMRWAPKNIYCECEEEVFTLQYGLTTDNGLWLASSKYWK